MVKMAELSARLLNRFKDVPGVEADDADAWIELSLNEHGFDGECDVPLEYVSLVMLYAEADGATQVALRTAYFFEYGDRDESVDKTKVSDHYRKLADTLWERYKSKRANGAGNIGGSSFTIMPRSDRP